MPRTRPFVPLENFRCQFSLRGSSRSIEPAMLTFSESRLSSACTADLAELSQDQICRCERFAVAKIERC